MEKIRGFTLVELMITLAILAILLTVGVPGMQELIRNNRLATVANDFITDLSLARSEAIKRGLDVVVCRTDAPNAATPVCGSGTANTWSDGWVMFTDDNQDRTYDAGETLLRVNQGLEGDLELMADATAETALAFAPDGSLADGAAATLALCDDRGEAKGRAIALGLVGRPNISKPAADCTP